MSWFENVPVISWLALNGKTKCCHKKLPVEYPLVELLMGLLFVFNGYQSPIGLAMIVLLVFSLVFDLKYMILPDFSTYILIVIAAIFFS